MPKPTLVRQSLVGTMLRQYREARNFSLEEAALILECDRSKISRVETGQRGIRTGELRKLLTEYGVADEVGDTLTAICHTRSRHDWWQPYRKVLPAPQLDFIITESVASTVSVYAPVRIPELLATPDYIAAMAEADLTVPEGLEDIRVQAVTTHRQASLFTRQPELTVILGEAALRQQIGDRVVMREQLTYLHKLSQAHTWITIRLLPFSAGATADSDTGAFSLLHFEHLPDVGVAHLADPAGGIYLDDPMLIAMYAKTFSHLKWYTMTREQSLARITELSSRQLPV